MKDNLEGLRKEMDAATAEVVAALNKRAEVAQRVGSAKQGESIYVPEREARVLENVQKQNKGPLSDQALSKIMKEVIGACRNLEQQLRVAYLGPEGTYSEEAAQQFAGSTSAFLPCASIDEVLAAVERGNADIAVVPVENSTEGTVNRTLDLLMESNLGIMGEITLPIHHQLLSRSTKLKEITEVVAHPQALAQCRLWLSKNLHNAKQIPQSSNAEAARVAAKDAHKAAIAGKIAADIYELHTLSANVEDVSNNTTRFLVLGTQSTAATGNDKTSLVCSVPNRAGSLVELLNIFSNAGINMTKLESRPAAGALWDYVFYIDIDGHESEVHIAKALKQTREHATLVKVLGSYPKARI